jgi:choline dehydrogenase
MVPDRLPSASPSAEIAAATLEAMEACGFPHVEDHNQPGAVGAGRIPMSSRDGIRVTSAGAYLPPVGAPSNLTILPDAHVAEVVLEDVRATGVRLSDGSLVRAGWVVLSSGTYGSPPILLRSGIGPPDHLRSMGLPVRIELPGVGEKLADHPAVDLEFGEVGGTTDAPLHAIATFHSAVASADDPPDLMLWTSDPSGDPPTYEIDVVLLKPRSRGSVRLRSPDPTDPPRIVLPGVRDPMDVTRLLEGYRRVEEVANDPRVRRLTGDLPPSIGNDGGAGAWIRANSYSIPHVVGTCSMGPSPHDGAVVDAAGQVHGAERLSVVDASIMPEAPSGFPHLVTIMIAERLSERIASAL